MRSSCLMEHNRLTCCASWDAAHNDTMITGYAQFNATRQITLCFNNSPERVRLASDWTLLSKNITSDRCLQTPPLFNHAVCELWFTPALWRVSVESFALISACVWHLPTATLFVVTSKKSPPPGPPSPHSFLSACFLCYGGQVGFDQCQVWSHSASQRGEGRWTLWFVTERVVRGPGAVMAMKPEELMGTFSRSGVGKRKGDVRVRVLTAPWLQLQQQPSLLLHLLPCSPPSEKGRRGEEKKRQNIFKGPPALFPFYISLLDGHISLGFGAAMSCCEVVWCGQE